MLDGLWQGRMLVGQSDFHLIQHLPHYSGAFGRPLSLTHHSAPSSHKPQFPSRRPAGLPHRGVPPHRDCACVHEAERVPLARREQAAQGPDEIDVSSVRPAPWRSLGSAGRRSNPTRRYRALRRASEQNRRGYQKRVVPPRHRLGNGRCALS